MKPTASLSIPSLLTLSFLLLLSSPATAFNITKLFSRHPEFSTFNDYLTQTNLASEINGRRTITVLAVDNSAIGALSGRTLDVVKKILSMHVVLDYYDALKLNNLSKRSAMLTTMFQSTGVAEDQQGFLNVTVLKSGEVMFGSAVKGSGLTAKLIQSVAAQPYNISVLQIDSVLIAPGIDVTVNHSNPSPPPPPPVAKAPTSSSDDESDADSPAPADVSDDSSDTAQAPAADAPASDDDAPASSPPAPEVVADADDKAAAPSPTSLGSRVGFGYEIIVVMGLSVFGLM